MKIQQRVKLHSKSKLMHQRGMKDEKQLKLILRMKLIIYFLHFLYIFSNIMKQNGLFVESLRCEFNFIPSPGVRIREFENPGRSMNQSNR